MEKMWFSRKHPRRRRPRVNVTEQEAAPTQAGAAQAAPSTAARPRGTGRGRVVRLLLWCLGVSTVVSFIVFKLILVPDVPRELVGTWEVSQGRMKGATLDIRADGKATAVLVNRGQKEVTHSTAKVEGKKL